MSWPEVVAVSVFLLCVVVAPLVFLYLIDRNDHPRRRDHDR